MEFTGCKNFTLKIKERLADIGSDAYVLEHDKTGARVVLIDNDDDNKAFIIGFKTIPSDSTGVPHILEHSVLCGSKKYPVKDAMTEVSKGSLNTYMNAYTYPDKTLYPIASCNDKDFQNLMSVYLDAVFCPQVYEREEIFKQEGWHYEMFEPDGDITINGVVYNEMKGVYSSPEDCCGSYAYMSLFPDTQYGVESGGDPKNIPDLKYEDFLNFHKKLYHPSNCRIYLYGNMDFSEKLEYIDREYLSKYEKLSNLDEIKIQKPFCEPKYITKEYSVNDDEDLKDSTFLTYNVVCSDFSEVDIEAAMSVINYALCSVPGAALEKNLLDAGIGKNIYSSFMNDIGQMVFSITAQDANPEDEERFVQIVEDTMKDIIENGFDKTTLEAAITSQEFSYREADYGFFPKGLVYGMYAFDQWNYCDEDFFTSLKQNEIYKDLRKKINEGYFEEILKERVLCNPHKTILKMVPKKGLLQKEDDELKAKLSLYKASLSKEEIAKLIEDTKALKKYQKEPDSDEALATIPTLSIDDINANARKTPYSKETHEDVTVVKCNGFTNGIAYVDLSFSTKTLPQEYFKYLSVLKLILGLVDTQSYEYSRLVNEIAIKSGGLAINTPIYRDIYDTDKYSSAVDVKFKAFYSQIKDAFELCREIIYTSKIDDKKRLKQILAETKTKTYGFVISNGHSVTLQRALSYVSKSGALGEELSGMDQYRIVEKLDSSFDELIDEYIEGMKKVIECVFTKENLTLSVMLEDRANDEFFDAFSEFLKNCKSKKQNYEIYNKELVKRQEAIVCPSQVQYVCVAGNFQKRGLPFTGSIHALREILSSDYLWTAVRLQGGAYGAMCSFSRNGDSFMVSYRDPKLLETLEAYKNAVKYLEEFPEDETLVERFVISAIGLLDTPYTPSQVAARAFALYMGGISDEVIQKERDELLATKPQTIRDLAKYVQAIIDDNCLCVVGGEEMLRNEGKDVYKEFVTL